YRVNSASMARTYASFPATNRLARNLAGLPLFEAFRLQGLMRSYAELRHRHETLGQSLEHAREQLRSNLSFRIAQRSTEMLNRHPYVKAPIKKLFLLVEFAFNRGPRGSA